MKKYLISFIAGLALIATAVHAQMVTPILNTTDPVEAEPILGIDEVSACVELLDLEEVLGGGYRTQRGPLTPGTTSSGGGASSFGDLSDVATSTDATGDVYYLNASGQITNLGLGTNGQVLKSNGTLPAWAADATAAGAADPFAWQTNFGEIYAVTSSPMWLQSHLAVTGTAYLTDVSISGNTTSTGNTVLKGSKNIDSYIQAYNGTFLEHFNATTTLDGTEIEVRVAPKSDYTGGLTMRFSTGDSTLTTPQSLYLVAGTDPSPQENFLYVPRSTKEMTTSTTGWPSEEHIKISYFLCPSASTAQTQGGCYINQNWNDGAYETDGQGHFPELSEKIRRMGATYFSGIDGNGDGGTYIERTDAVPDTVYLKITAGVVYQVHAQTVPAYDTSGASDFHMVNSSVSAYETGSDLYNFLVDADGDSMVGNYYNLVIWMVANKGNGDAHSPLMINLPTCSYNSLSQAQSDSSGCDVFTMPREFNRESSTGFLVARLTMRHTVAGSDLTLQSTVDLRGTTPANATGGTAGGNLVDFADNNFSIYDSDDITRILNIDAGSITTGNTRTLTIPDASGTITLLDATQTLSNKTFSSAILANANNTIDIGAFGTAYKNIYASSTIFANYVSSTMIEATSFVGALTGNADTASTATASADNPDNCAAGSYPLGVDANWDVESCTDASTEIDSIVATHALVAAAHQALVTLAGQDYATLSGQEITFGEIEPDDLAASDFGDFSCNGTTCTLDATYLTDITGEALGSLSNVDLTGATAGNIMYLQSDGNWVDVATSTFAFQTDLHDAVTIGGEDYISLSGQELTANAIDADNLSATDFGDFSCNGTTCSLDANTVGSSEMDLTAAFAWTGLHEFANASTTLFSSDHTSSTAWVGGGLNIDCDGAGDNLGWDVTTERFVCGTDSTTAGTDPFTWAQHFGETYTATTSPFWAKSHLAVSGTAWLEEIALLPSTDPTVSLNGEIAINSTAASSSIRYFDGTAERALYPETDKSFSFASTTLAYVGDYGALTTTTMLLSNSYHPFTVTHMYCKTDVGQAFIEFTDGSNKTDYLICTTSGASDDGSIANATFNMREDFKISIGNQTTNPSLISVTATVRQDAD